MNVGDCSQKTTDKMDEQREQCISWNEQEIKGFFGFGDDEYGFLSNFQKCPVLYDGVIYPSSENAYMAAKTLDLEKRKEFENITPPEARKLGQTVKLRGDWVQVKFDIMYVILLDKFIRNEKLRERLLATEGKYLEETNWWEDKIWGVCIKTGEGYNNLGKLLMLVRSILKK